MTPSKFPQKKNTKREKKKIAIYPTNKYWYLFRVEVSFGKYFMIPA